MTSGVQIAAIRTGVSYSLSTSLSFLLQGAFGIQSVSMVLQPEVAASMTNAESRILVVMKVFLFDR